MAQDPDIERILHRARLLLQEGQNDLVIAGLAAISTENEVHQQEIAYLRGVAYLMTGKEFQAKTKQLEDEQQRELLREAIEWYKLAQKQFSLTPRRDKVAEMYRDWAEALEDLGYLEEALIYLKSAYEVSLTDDPG